MPRVIGSAALYVRDAQGRLVCLGRVIELKTCVSNVVGGSLDGALIPPGTRDGQRLQWDADRQRWVGK